LVITVKWLWLTLIVLVLLADIFCRAQVVQNTANLGVQNIFTQPNQFTVGASFGPVFFSTLPAESNGTEIYCSNCRQTNPCVSGGSGAMATGIAGSWSCASGIVITLETNGTVNGSQTLLNLAQSSPITVTDNGSGTITLACPTCAAISGLTAGVVPVAISSSAIGNSNLISVQTSLISMGTGCSTACNGGALNLTPYTGTNTAVYLSDSNGDTLRLGNLSGSNTANMTLSNVNLTSGIANTTGSITYVYGNPLYLGTNPAPGGFSAPTPLSGIQITPSGTAILGPLLGQYGKLRCQSSRGDGLNVIGAGTYLQSFCYNDSGVTWTITGIKCFTDNNGTSTLNASGNTLGALLTGAITCTTAFAAGTQTANILLTSGDYIKFTFVGDGASKQSTWIVTFTQ
jgi:hypothetical protein